MGGSQGLPPSQDSLAILCPQEEWTRVGELC